MSSRLLHPSDDQPRLIRGLKAGAHWIGISERKLWSLVNCNAVPHRRIDRVLAFVPGELDTWIDAGCPTEADAGERIRKAMRRGVRR